MVLHPEEELVVFYEISVRVGKQELAGARRRFREFHKLHRTLAENYPHLLNGDNPTNAALDDDDTPIISRPPPMPLPSFPRKHIFRAGWDPVVVTERVGQLNEWLSAVCDKLQFASLELVSFLNVPLYAAIRLLSGDLQARAHARTPPDATIGGARGHTAGAAPAFLRRPPPTATRRFPPPLLLTRPIPLAVPQPDDFVEPCSPDTVITSGVRPPSLSAGLPDSPSKAGSVQHRSPMCDRRSLHALAGQLTHSVQRPGYNESALFVARAIVAHAHAAAIARPPALDEAHKFVRTVCGRALFKPCSLIATVIYMDRLHRTELHGLLAADGWQLTLLTLLIIAAKVWDSDFPISNADICAPGALPRSAPGDRTISTRRVNQAERRILAMLDFCTIVQPGEFARYYLTLPFAFPHADGHGHASVGRSPSSDWALTLPPAFLSDEPRDCLPPSKSDAGLRVPEHRRRSSLDGLERRFGGLVQPGIDGIVPFRGLAPSWVRGGYERADSLP